MFELGQVVVAREADAFLEKRGQLGKLLTIQALIGKHRQLDQGTLDDEDHETNRRAVEHGARIFSAFEVPPIADEDEATKVWVITEADRSSTCILLPSEY